MKIIGKCSVHYGGLMRCCCLTLEEKAEEQIEPDVPIKCNYCGGLMRLDGETIRWKKPEEEKK